MTVTRGQLVTLERIAKKDGWAVESGSAATVVWTAPNGRSVRTGREANGSEFTAARHNLEMAGLIIPGRRPRNLSQVVDLAPKTEEETVAKQAPPKTEPVAVELNWEDPKLSIREGAHEAHQAVSATFEDLARQDRLLRRVVDELAPRIGEREEVIFGAITTVEDLVNEVADSLKRHRDSYQDTVPVLRRDIAQLKEAFAALPTEQQIRGWIGEALNQQLVALEHLVKQRINDAAAEYLEVVEATEERLEAKIAAAQAKADPLGAIRRRLGEG